MKRASIDAAAALELQPGQSVPLLKELHILTRDGRLNQDSRRKLKQVMHLFQFIEKLLLELGATGDCSGVGGETLCAGQTGAVLAEPEITVADHGAGKSYLGFVIYDLFFKARQNGRIYGIETRTELVQKSSQLAARLGFERMAFINTSVAESTESDQLPAHIDLVTALHACDSATDDAIAFGLKKNADYMVLVPCCQAEVAHCLNQNKALALAHTPLAELWRHPLHTREFGSHLTNVLRCLYLQACGYHVSVTELVGWEHSMKNELIMARRVGQANAVAAQRLQTLLQEFGLGKLGQIRFNHGPIATS